MRRPQRDRSEQGETLLELIIAMAIMGAVVIAVGASIALSIRVSGIHRQQATAQQYLHNYVEAVSGSYTACSGSTAPNYVSVSSLATPSGFTTPTASVKFWDAPSAAFTTSTCPATDPGLQQVTFTLTSSDGRVTESLVAVVRKAT